jgi:hypothetical protein
MKVRDWSLEGHDDEDLCWYEEVNASFPALVERGKDGEGIDGVGGM